jgi:membrane protein DedA with SNARE-associated domain
VCNHDSMASGAAELLAHWGYGAIFVAVILGNIGFPVPEETILALGGYMAQRGALRLDVVMAIGIVSAVTGDAIGYWLGRRYGRRAIERYGRWVYITPARLDKVCGFVTRYGAWAVFCARFVAGLRFLAGPLAGATGLRPLAFAAGNVLGAGLFVPMVVGLGYLLGRAFGDDIERLVRHVEHAALGVALVLALVLVMARLIRARRVPA